MPVPHRALLAPRRLLLAAAFALPGAALPAPLPARGQALPPERIAELTAAREAEAFALYRDFLRLPNDANHPDDILRVLEWLEREFGMRGFETERLPMPGSDALLATRGPADAERAVLIYLQADGQPVDPSAWDQESPWEPVLKRPTADGGWEAIPWDRLTDAPGGPNPDWRIFARSASDSKGPIVQFLSAISLLDEAGVEPGFRLKVIVDTEEEMGSPHLPAAVERFREELAADMLVIFDGPPHYSGEPTLTFGARGIATITLTVHGPRAPQHSGHYGNYVPNPAQRLAALLASMEDAEGRVTIPGFYDGIAIDAATRRVLARVPDDPEELRGKLGIAAPERVAPTLQAALQYPSLNVRGMRAAWVGEQARTIIPATATAEIDLRLVVESDPERLVRLVRQHVEGRGYTVLDRAPTDEERLRHPRIATFTHVIAYRAYRTPFDAEPGRWLSAGLARLFGEEPIRIRTSGGSIPISPFVTTLGVPAVSMGTVNPDNNQHSPNENLRVGDFLRGIRMMAAVLSEPLPDRDPSAPAGSGR